MSKDDILLFIFSVFIASIIFYAGMDFQSYKNCKKDGGVYIESECYRVEVFK